MTGFEYSVAQAAKKGFNESGDGYFFETLTHGALLAVIDGLGHGTHAATATHAAVETLKQHPYDNPLSLMQRCHQSLIGTRGAVMSLAQINIHSGELIWLGVGNVEGVLIRGGSHERLMLRGGVVGYRMPTLRTFTHHMSAGDMLILVTDGIRSAFLDDIPLNGSPQDIADHILTKHNRHTDDALALVARWA